MALESASCGASKNTPYSGPEAAINAALLGLRSPELVAPEEVRAAVGQSLAPTSQIQVKTEPVVETREGVVEILAQKGEIEGLATAANDNVIPMTSRAPRSGGGSSSGATGLEDFGKKNPLLKTLMDQLQAA